jgi:hypothetical protein
MNMRGLVPSLGAGGSLIAAAVCALAVFGGALAFQGESPGTAEANAGDLVVPGRNVRAQTSSPGLVMTVLTVADTARPAAGVRAQRRAATRVGTRSAPRRTTARSAPGSATPSTPAVTSPGRSTPASPPRAPKPSSPPPEIVPPVSVEHVVEETRSAVKPVVDAVPPPAQAPVEQVADTVQDVAGTVDETVDGVTGLVLP